jgi:hypothetical protein
MRMLSSERIKEKKKSLFIQFMQMTLIIFFLLITKVTSFSLFTDKNCSSFLRRFY